MIPGSCAKSRLVAGLLIKQELHSSGTRHRRNVLHTSGRFCSRSCPRTLGPTSPRNYSPRTDHNGLSRQSGPKLGSRGFGRWERNSLSSIRPSDHVRAGTSCFAPIHWNGNNEVQPETGALVFEAYFPRRRKMLHAMRQMLLIFGNQVAYYCNFGAVVSFCWITG